MAIHTDPNPTLMRRACPNGPLCFCTGACFGSSREHDQFHRPLKEMFAPQEDGRFAVPAEKLWWITADAMRPEDV